MAGAAKSRLDKAGGDPHRAAQMLAEEFAAGARGWSPAQIAAYTNPATRDAWVAQKIRQSTKGKYSGVLGAVAKTVKTAAPIAAAFIPGIGPVAAGALAAGSTAAGQALSGERVNVGRAALSGLGAYGAKSLMSGAGPTSDVAGPTDLTGLAKLGGKGGGGGGLLSRIGGGIADFVTSDPERAIRLGLGGLGAIQASQAAGRANALQERALAPLFGGGVNPYANLPVDEGNPYARRRPTGQQSLYAELAR